MKPFNLERAIAGDKVVTGDGKVVKFVGHFPELYTMSVVAVLGSRIGVFAACGSGYYSDEPRHEEFLFMAPKLVTLYVNIYRDGDGGFGAGNIYDTECEAKHHGCDVGFVKTISFEVDE